MDDFLSKNTTSSAKDSQTKDACFLMPNHGCTISQGTLIRYYYDPRDKICRPFAYGGCGGSLNINMKLLSQAYDF